MNVEVFQEFQGQGSPHADEHGWCWCAKDETGKTSYLEAKTKEEAEKEAAAKSEKSVDGVEP